MKTYHLSLPVGVLYLPEALQEYLSECHLEFMGYLLQRRELDIVCSVCVLCVCDHEIHTLVHYQSHIPIYNQDMEVRK